MTRAQGNIRSKYQHQQNTKYPNILKSGPGISIWGTRSAIFGTPKKAKRWSFSLAILGVPKMALWVPESKFQNHFSLPFHQPSKPPTSRTSTGHFFKCEPPYQNQLLWVKTKLSWLSYVSNPLDPELFVDQTIFYFVAPP